MNEDFPMLRFAKVHFGSESGFRLVSEQSDTPEKAFAYLKARYGGERIDKVSRVVEVALDGNKQKLAEALLGLDALFDFGCKRVRWLFEAIVQASHQDGVKLWT